ncbi:MULTISPECIES: STAS domain-containing protein [Streptomyces]|uniref:STAS domain-containing protein n=1 Tax=Streptomyces TaxID=1883 RepID=UPI0029B7B80F|nr:STAS domain-containing protein [Streptomyces scabiei]MDX3114701.1 STAS domain-containing protein [Streptomyces scabiei]
MTDIDTADQPEQFSVEQRIVDGVRVVSVQGEIDHDVQDILTEALLARHETIVPPRIVADLSGVTFMDSTGINVFVTAHRAVSDTDGWVRIAGAQDSVLRVLELVGVDALITCHPTLEHALRP